MSSVSSCRSFHYRILHALTVLKALLAVLMDSHYLAVVGWIRAVLMCVKRHKPEVPMHRFEFPQELDMYKYTVDGLAAKEEADAAAASAAGPSESAANADVASTSSAAAESAATSAAEPTSPKNPPNAKQYQYSLKGIVVHSGSAFAGHYYSYIKVGCARYVFQLPAVSVTFNCSSSGIGRKYMSTTDK